MKIHLLVAVAVALSGCAAAMAQDNKALDGSWTAQWRPQSAGPVANAQMTLRDSAGTWRASFVLGEGRTNPCLERAHPANVKEVAPGKFRLAIEASKMVPSCQNAYATLELVAPNRLAGKWNNGQELKLERK